MNLFYLQNTVIKMILQADDESPLESHARVRALYTSDVKIKGCVLRRDCQDRTSPVEFSLDNPG